MAKRKRKKMAAGTRITVEPDMPHLHDPFYADDNPTPEEMDAFMSDMSQWDMGGYVPPADDDYSGPLPEYFGTSFGSERTAATTPFLGFGSKFAPEPPAKRPAVPAWTKETTRLPAPGQREVDNRLLSDMSTQVDTRTPATLTGMAIGDALGRPYEFCRDHQKLYSWNGAMLDGGWGLKAGQWTDDTKMGLCIAESLLSLGAFDYADIADRYIAWVDTGDTRGIGGTCGGAISRMRSATNERLMECGGNTGSYCGNGTCMRIAPLAVFYRNELDTMLDGAYADAMLTHAHWDAVESSQALCVMIAELVNGTDPVEAVTKGRDVCDPKGHVYEMIDMALTCAQEDRAPWHVSVGGRADTTMCTAVWAFLMYRESFQKALETAVRMGGDADTRGAVTGALAGAYCGLEGIPEEWLAVVEDREWLAALDWLLMYGDEEGTD